MLSQEQKCSFLILLQSYIYLSIAAAAAKSRQSCPTLCDPIDGSPTGSPVPGILQARTLEWVAISWSNAWKWKVKVKPLSRVRLLATPWTIAYQAPPSMGFSRQEYRSGVPLPSPDLSIESYRITVFSDAICSFSPFAECVPCPEHFPRLLRSSWSCRGNRSISTWGQWDVRMTFCQQRLPEVV